MERKNNILRGAVVLLIAVAMFLSTIAVTADTSIKPILPHNFNSEVHKGYTEVNPKGVVLWDNGMHHQGLIASQYDSSYPFEAIGADDFQFEETTEITDVHWLGGYWNPAEDGDFEWKVIFYMDRGDGMAPGDKIYEHVFPNADVHETFIEEFLVDLIFSYWVDLPEPITFIGGEKYWISIQGVGIFPPQCGWSPHYPLILHKGVFKSSFFGYDNWTDSTEVFDNPLDFCFQLTGDGEPVAPDLECEGDIRWEEVPPGAVVNSTFTVSNIGDVGSMLEWKVLSVPEDWGTNWSVNWSLDWEPWWEGGFVGTKTPEEVFVEVKAPDEKNKKFEGEIVLVNSDDPEDTCSISVMLNTPRSRETYNILLLRLFERFPNAFPILRQLLGL